MYDIVKWAVICRLQQKKNEAQQPAWISDQALQQAFARYHQLKLSDKTIPQKLQRLQAIMEVVKRKYADAMRMAPASVLAVQYGKMQYREHYLQQLHKLQTDATKQEKATSLIQLLNDGTKKRCVTETNGAIRGTVTETHLHEKLDPMHRGIFDLTFRAEFKKWREHWTDWEFGGQRPPSLLGKHMCCDLVRFLIGYEQRRGKTEKRRLGEAVLVDVSPMKLAACAGSYYALYIKSDGKNIYERYNPRYHKGYEMLKPLPYHTCEGGQTANYSGRRRDQGNTDKEKDLQWADLYVMRKSVLYTIGPYSTWPGAPHFQGRGGMQGKITRVHPTLSNYKSVEAAGMIISRRGKILAVDNESGHFTPDRKQLEQVVKQIDKDKAFLPEAFVGVSYAANRRLFFPYRLFLQLSAAGWPMGRTINEITALRQQNGASIIGGGQHDEYLKNVKGIYNWDESIYTFLRVEYPGFEDIYEQAREFFKRKRWTWSADALAQKLPFTPRTRFGSSVDETLRTTTGILKAAHGYDEIYHRMEARFRTRGVGRFVNMLEEIPLLLTRRAEFLTACATVDPNLAPGLGHAQAHYHTNPLTWSPLQKLAHEATGRLTYETNPLRQILQRMSTLRAR